MDTTCHIPAATIARVFQEVSFKDPQTLVSAPAIVLSSEYIRLFVREAVLRANEQRVAELETAPKVEDEEMIPAEKTHNNEEKENIDRGIDDDEQGDEEDFSNRELGVSIQLELPPVNDALETRHLAEISGLLLMDF